MKKRLFATFLSVMMLLALLPATAFATPTVSIDEQWEASTHVTAGKITESLTAKASVDPSGTATLNWYACSESGVISGESLFAGETFAIPTDLDVGVYFYCCQATCAGAPPVNSSVAAVLVRPDVTFTTQPAESTTVTAGSISGNLTVETSVYPADTTGLTLNWYRCSSGGEFIYGESLGTGKTFVIPKMLTPATYYYLCRATIGTSLEVNSSVAEVIVEEAQGTTSTIEFTTQPYTGRTDVFEGFISEQLTAAASVSPSGTPTLNWYECTGLSGVVTGGPSLGTGETFAIPTDLKKTELKDTYYYICQATYPGAAPVNSNVATVIVNIAEYSTLLFTTHPASSTTVKEGSISGSLTAEAKVAPLSSGFIPTLTWYECGEDGIVSGPLLSTTTTLTIPTDLSKGTYYYRCTASCAEPSPSYAESRIAKVIVLDSDAETVTTPTFSPSGGTYTAAQNVTLSCATPGATIRYTTDGSDPTETSSTYSTAIAVSDMATIKAKAFKDGMMTSETAKATYKITNLPELVLAASPSNKVTQGTVVTLTATPKNISDPSEYSWYCVNGEITTPVSGATQATYKPPTDTAGTLKYYCIVSTTTSNVVELEVTASEPTVTSVEVNPASVSIQKGGNQTFTATVTGKNSPAQTVTWTVAGGVTGTSIDADGVLTIAANETAATLTVKATSTVDTAKSGTATVKVTTPPTPPVETVATPTFSPAAGTYTAAQNVTLSCATPGATIRYTTNGSEPTETSSAYSTAIAVSDTATIKAKAFKDGMTASAVATATYTITTPPTPDPDPVAKYIVIEGADGKWTAGSADGLTVKANGDYAKFQGVSVDGSIISKDKYSDKSGSTIVTLKPAYLQTLSVGKHTLRVNYTDGYAETTFSIAARGANPVPQTGDSGNATLLIALLLVGGAGLIAASAYFRKKRRSAAK